MAESEQADKQRTTIKQTASKKLLSGIIIIKSELMLAQLWQCICQLAVLTNKTKDKSWLDKRIG